jgi:uncharacterized protein YecT (DUF1311 family)
VYLWLLFCLQVIDIKTVKKIIMLKIIYAMIFCMAAMACTAQSQATMSQDAGAAYQKADKELNDVYQRILKEYKEDTVFINNLKNAQRLWVQFRDAEVAMKYPDTKNYRSAAPMCINLYLTALTKERTEKLNVWLTGIEEGDVCAGSVKMKE